MEEKKSRFFDFDSQAKIDNPDNIKVEEPVKKDDTFSKIFGSVEIKKEEEPKPQTPSTFESVFKTNLPEKKDSTVAEAAPLVDNKVETPKPSSQTNFSEVFHTDVKVEEVKPVKKEEVPSNASKFFNVEPKVEEKVEVIKTEESTTEYVEKVGDNPMIDYERINREAMENAPTIEEEEELPKMEESLQSNSTLTTRVNMGGSDLMRLRMQRK